MITPSYVRAMAAYNAEMNRRLYAAANRLADAERRAPRGGRRAAPSGARSTVR
jgi:uncharacterized damage-inducible protein DinB